MSLEGKTTPLFHTESFRLISYVDEYTVVMLQELFKFQYSDQCSNFIFNFQWIWSNTFIDFVQSSFTMYTRVPISNEISSISKFYL